MGFLTGLVVAAALGVTSMQSPTGAVASFPATFKGADKKFVMVEVEGGQTLRLYITGSTKYVREGKPAKAAAFHNGDKVDVDAERDLRMNMLAVRVVFPQTPKKDDPNKSAPQ